MASSYTATDARAYEHLMGRWSVYQRIFWDPAAALDPDAELARGRHFSSPLTREGELAAAFEVAGLRDVEPASLTIRMEYSEFSDY